MTRQVPEESDRARVEQALENICLGLLLTLLVIGGPFVIKYRSEGAVHWGYSARYLYGVVIPLDLVSLTLAALALARQRRAAVLAKVLPPALLETFRPVVGACFLLAGAASVVYGFLVSDEYVSLLMMIVLPCAIALGWSMTTGAASGGAGPSRANLLLACLPVLVGGILLFAVEIPGLLAGSPLVVWGDESTFATLFPREAPYIGPGGRLKPGLDVRMRAPEYPNGARLATNSQGFRNQREFGAKPAAGELRLLSLGDSFSTGFCAEQDRFFGSLLEKRLASTRPGGEVTVMNAEVSDPAYGLYYLQQFGVHYHPEIVIYGLSGNDMMQAEQFSGDDRLFKLDGRGRLLPNPAFDPTLASAWDRYREFEYPAVGSSAPSAPGVLATLLSKLVRFHFFSALAEAAERQRSQPVDMPGYAQQYESADGHKRFIDGSANLGFFYRKRLEPVERMYAAAFELIEAMDRSAREGGARFLLVIYPQRYQVQPRDWEVMRKRWNLDDLDFDLGLANRRLEEFCRTEGVACCDLMEPFRRAATGQDLFLPGGDTHFNRHGHEVAARAVEECLIHAPDPERLQSAR